MTHIEVRRPPALSHEAGARAGTGHGRNTWALLLLATASVISCTGLGVASQDDRRRGSASAQPPYSILDLQGDITIVHLTDLHLRANDSDNWTDTDRYAEIVRDIPIVSSLERRSDSNLVETFPIASRAIAMINDHLRPDLVVITGDILNKCDGDPATRTQAEALLGTLQVPYVAIRGNHDLQGSDDDSDPFAFKSNNPCDGFIQSDDRRVLVNGFPVFSVPYGADEDTLAAVEKLLVDETSTKPYYFLAMHALQDLSSLEGIENFVDPDLQYLDPSADAIFGMIAARYTRENAEHKTLTQFIVLNGHTHSHNESTYLLRLHMLTTGSLAFAPNELRMVKVIGEDYQTEIMSLDTLAGHYSNPNE